MNINDLPNECLYLILGTVVIAEFDDCGDSTLANLQKCRRCFENDFLCSHLHEKEVVGKKILKLVCKRWQSAIDAYFKFTSGVCVNLQFL